MLFLMKHLIRNKKKKITKGWSLNLIEEIMTFGNQLESNLIKLITYILLKITSGKVK